jgi:hypothetical protein
VIVTIACASLLNACALSNGRYQNVAITTNVPATIRVDGQYAGNTSSSGEVIARLRRSKSHHVRADADGYDAQTIGLSTEFSMLGGLDVVGCALILVPCITLITGHAFELEPSLIRVELERTKDEDPS